MQKNSIIHHSNLIFTVHAVTQGGYTREKFSSKHLSLSLSLSLSPHPPVIPFPSPPDFVPLSLLSASSSFLLAHSVIACCAFC